MERVSRQRETIAADTDCADALARSAIRGSAEEASLAVGGVTITLSAGYT